MPQLSTISRWYDPFNLRPEDVAERDLIISLSHLCRFNGHIELFYSVAQHSIAVARLVKVRGGDPPTVLQALLHDAPEAYLCGDIPGPLKKHLRVYPGDVQEGYHGSGIVSESVNAVEWDMRQIIHESLGCALPTEEREEMVHQADRDVLRVEFFHLKPKALHLKFMLSSDMKDDALRMGLITHGDNHPLSIQIHFSDEFNRLRGLLQ